MTCRGPRARAERTARAAAVWHDRSVPGGLIFFVAIVALFVALAGWQYRRNKARRDKLQRYALASGWTYTPEDDAQCQRWERAPFNAGFDRRARTVLSGRFRNHEMLAFDYSYKTRSTDSRGQVQTQTHRYRVCSLALPASLPYMHVRPENVVTRLGNAMGMHDIELESEDFNRRFRVHADDPKFAYDVLGARTLQKLLTLPKFEWSIDGATIVSWAPGANDVPDLLARLTTLTAVVDGIPGFVWHDHGVAPSPPGGIA
jgi:hypothetical protein